MQRIFKYSAMQVRPFFCTTFWNFWHIICLSISNHRKVINAETNPIFFGPPCTTTTMIRLTVYILSKPATSLGPGLNSKFYGTYGLRWALPQCFYQKNCITILYYLLPSKDKNIVAYVIKTVKESLPVALIPALTDTSKSRARWPTFLRISSLTDCAWSSVDTDGFRWFSEGKSTHQRKHLSLHNVHYLLYISNYRNKTTVKEKVTHQIIRVQFPFRPISIHDLAVLSNIKPYYSCTVYSLGISYYKHVQNL